MDNFKKLANGAIRSGMLGAGLLGLYLVHKKRIPEYMGFASYCITCMGLYALTTFFMDIGYEESDRDQENEGSTTGDVKSASSKYMAETPKSKKEWGIARRSFLKEFREETDRILESFPKVAESDSDKTESENIQRIFINLSDLAHINRNAPDDVSDLLKKVSQKLDEIKAGEDGASVPNSPKKLEMLDIKIQNPEIYNSDMALTQYVKEIIAELQVGEISLLIDSEKKE